MSQVLPPHRVGSILLKNRTCHGSLRLFPQGALGIGSIDDLGRSRTEVGFLVCKPEVSLYWGDGGNGCPETCPLLWRRRGKGLRCAAPKCYRGGRQCFFVGVSEEGGA